VDREGFVAFKKSQFEQSFENASLVPGRNFALRAHLAINAIGRRFSSRTRSSAGFPALEGSLVQVEWLGDWTPAASRPSWAVLGALVLWCSGTREGEAWAMTTCTHVGTRRVTR
jgi:hypothetical protein